jgi:tetratricopeptide (TPR) repeat protein
VAKKTIERKTLIDTVYWNAYDEQGNYDKNSKLPPRLSALKIASQMAGENYSKRFLASWVTVKRMYSIPPLPDFEAAEKYLLKGDWDNAIMLWKRYAADKNGKMAINARYNLALAYEMKDDLETANQWLTAAQQIAADYRSKEDLKRIAAYQKVLAQRIKEVERLKNI